MYLFVYQSLMMYPEFVPLRINLSVIWLKCFGKKHGREMQMCAQRHLCLDFPLTLQPGSRFRVALRTLCKLLAAISKGSGNCPIMEPSLHKCCPRLHWESLSVRTYWTITSLTNHPQVQGLVGKKPANCAL